MRPGDSARRLMPSIVDRLIDPMSMDGTSPGYDLREMIDRVRRDLEDLLNTRRSAAPDDDYKEVSQSVMLYGLPDLTAINGTSKEQREKLADDIARAIERYEPRLKDVVVRPTGGTKHMCVAANFHIQAFLNVDPAPQVGFETTLELASGFATLKPGEVSE